MLSARQAVERLRAGNDRFIAGRTHRAAATDRARRAELVAGQRPFAVILGCSDSRVPVELVFDQGLGDLFVVRVAGNVAAPPQVGSVEFAAEQFGTRLVVVLGHSECGAVRATVDAMQRPGRPGSPNLASIVDHIRPSLDGLLQTEPRHGAEALLRHAVRANVRAAADHLRRRSGVLEPLIGQDGLRVVGAEYSLQTGVVDFFDGVPEASSSPRPATAPGARAR